MESKSTSRDERIMRQKDELKEYQGRQIEAVSGGEPMPMAKANRNKNFEILKSEADGYVHLMATSKHDNPATKEYVKETHHIKIHAREFDRRVKEGAFKTYDAVEVIHDPRKNAPKDPKEYGLQPDFAQVEKEPKDKNVETNKGTTKIQAAGRPGDKTKTIGNDLGAGLDTGNAGAGSDDGDKDNQGQGAEA